MRVEQTASFLLFLSNSLMTFPFSAQGIPVPSTLLFGGVVKPFFPLATQFTSIIPLLDPSVECLMQDKNQRQSTSVPALLPSVGLNFLEKPTN